MEPMELTPVPSRRAPRHEGEGGKRAAHATPQSQSLTPNNDGDERQMLRRKSAAKVMRKSLGKAGLPGVEPGPAKGQGMAAAELKSMYEAVIRLTAENKINRNNVWELDLICHMPAIVRDYSLVGRDFNFQRASCGLDAGVSIYSKRVDSVHETAEALAGFGVKEAQEDDRDADGARDQDGEEGAGAGEEQAGRAKASRRKGGAYADPSGTLSDAASLRAKEPELTFDSDPLFGKTSRLFDESSAAGLLMLNMGVWGDCEIMFESSQVPSSKFPLPSEHEEEPEVQVDLSCLPGLQQLLDAAAQPRFTITPSIEQLYEQLGPQGAWGEGVLPDTAQILTAALAEEARARRFYAPAARGGAPARGASAAQQGSQGPDTSGVSGMEGVEQGGMEGVEEGPVGEGEEEGAGDAVGPGSPGGWGSDGVPDTGFGNEGEGMEVEGAAAAAGGEADGGQQGAGAARHFQLDEDGFVAGAAGWDGEGEEAAGAGGQYAGGGGSDGEGDEDDEGAEGPADVTDWLVNQAKSLLASQQHAAPLRGARAGAGSSFFRYAAAKQAAQGAAAVAKKAAPRKGKSKTLGGPPRLDSDDEDPELGARMADKGRPEETQLCRRSRAKTLLPADFDAACSAQRLFTLLDTACGPLDILGIWRSHAAAAAAEAAAAAAARRGGHGDAAGAGGGEEGGYGDQGVGDDDDGVYGFGDGEAGEGDGAEVGASGHALMQAAADAAAAAGLLAPGGLQLDAGFDGLQPQEGFLGGLLPAPRKVQKIEVTYDKVAKVVDVKLLKEVLHSSIHSRLQVKREGVVAAAGDPQSPPVQLAFQEIMAGLHGSGSGQGSGEAGVADGARAGEGQGAGPAASPAQFKDLSVHLCFICLLHLANDHGLQLSNHGQLDQLSVCRPGTAALGRGPRST